MRRQKDYFVTYAEFKGIDESGDHRYLLSFNKSLVHAGNLSKIEDGLNENRILEELKDYCQQRIEEISLSPSVSNEEMGRVRELRGLISMIEDITVEQ